MCPGSGVTGCNVGKFLLASHLHCGIYLFIQICHVVQDYDSITKTGDVSPLTNQQPKVGTRIPVPFTYPRTSIFHIFPLVTYSTNSLIVCICSSLGLPFDSFSM